MITAIRRSTSTLDDSSLPGREVIAYMDQSIGKLRWLRASTLIAGIAVLVSACGSSSTATKESLASSYNPVKGTTGGQLIFSDWESVQDLNVLSSSAQTTQQVLTGPVFSLLWGFDSQNKPIPDLVTDVTTTANGMVKKIDATHMDITIKLKSGLKWSDGSPLTSADVRFTVAAYCTPDVGASSQLGS